MLIGLLVALQLTQSQTVPRDSIERLRDEARRAEATFERLARRLIPIRYGVEGGNCDEVVGRFCLIYDSGRPNEPDPEHGRVTDARRNAIEALRAVFSYLPGDFATAAPLVRYLVEDDRAGEAASTARLFEIVSGDSVWGPLLRGFAEHAAGNDSTAQRMFNDVLDRMPTDERRRILAIEWVVDYDERGDYRRLDGNERTDFERRFWAFADPLYLTPGNERWNEHIARHIWSRMLERTPVVGDMMRWGEDLEQLTVRYGVPIARTRSPGTISRDGSITEHYDPDQLAFAPEALLRDGPPPPSLPGRPWELERKRSRSGYATNTVRRMVALPHQVTRFPGTSGFTIRVDGLFAMDSVATGASTAEAGLFIVGDGYRILDQKRQFVPIMGDTARPWFEIGVEASEVIYSLEVIETSTRFAGRARYSIARDSAALPLSDPLITFPWGPDVSPESRMDQRVRPRASLVLEKTDTIGLYAESAAMTPGGAYDVRLSIEPASRGSLPSRVVSWLGDKLGISDPAPPTRLQWSAAAGNDGRAVVAVLLYPRDDRTGDQVIVLRMTDRTTGRSAETRRIIRVGPVG